MTVHTFIPLNLCSDHRTQLLQIIIILLQFFVFKLQFQLIRGDGLPEQLCTKCVGRLKLAFEFRKQSESSAAHLRSFISKVNKQFTQVTTVNNDNDDEADMEEYLFDGEFGEQVQDESTVLQSSSGTLIKELDVEQSEIVHKIKAEIDNVESETIEEVIFDNNEDEAAADSNSNDDVEQMEEVIMETEVYEEEHLLDDVYLEEQVKIKFKFFVRVFPLTTNVMFTGTSL